MVSSSNLEKELCYQMCLEKALKQFEKESPYSKEYLFAITLQGEGYSIKEIAEKIGKTGTATRQFLSKARNKLKPYLQHCLDDCDKL